MIEKEFETEFHFIDDQNGPINPMPTFVTTTSIQSVLKSNGMKALQDLETRSTTRSLTISIKKPLPAQLTTHHYDRYIFAPKFSKNPMQP
ncbi:hypothetical protein IRZ48_00270 [Pseudomonas fulva]|uniref:hypothetical protein n=1 Tax=Pseudomonas fulva TaxID=47880 RepID=UPI0018A98F52|nr:hypothetical protein [Pseudomonas fulva]MBF8637665.1 hypothetical protein [Pseudomonas fulva]MBF8687021.1 hypothetical protein [Pseudomonas fulva]